MIGHGTSIPLSYGHENSIPKNRISKSFDLAGQNKALKDPEQVYIGKATNIGRFLAHLWLILGSSGDHLGMIWACSGHVLGGSPACFNLEKSTYINFQKIDFLKIGVTCVA